MDSGIYILWRVIYLHIQLSMDSLNSFFTNYVE